MINNQLSLCSSSSSSSSSSSILYHDSYSKAANNINTHS